VRSDHPMMILLLCCEGLYSSSSLSSFKSEGHCREKELMKPLMINKHIRHMQGV
jgi:hypothetical protein